jgi:hypothetical protein
MVRQDGFTGDRNPKIDRDYWPDRPLRRMQTLQNQCDSGTIACRSRTVIIGIRPSGVNDIEDSGIISHPHYSSFPGNKPVSAGFSPRALNLLSGTAVRIPTPTRGALFPLGWDFLTF